MKHLYTKSLWWGYLHTNGNYQAKRYLDELDIVEARQSPFVSEIVGPFEAKDRDEALSITKLEIEGKGK